MSEAYLTNWAMGNHFDDRDRFHAVALHEAQVATDHHSAARSAEPRERLISRLRLAFGRPAPIEACDCTAAA